MIDKLKCEIDITTVPSFRSAKLIYIEGKGLLKTKISVVKKPYQDIYYNSQLCLNDIPLIQMRSPECSTCASLLATGYGLDKCNCRELDIIRNRINEPFVSLDKSIDDIEPILSLLESGLYIVADAVCFPTDGNGNFFWNVPNELTLNSATTGMFHYDDNYNYVSGQPVYLYPTQNTDCFDEYRVKDYLKIFSDDGNNPRAVVYSFSEYINFVLDGHHKACASALRHKPVNCLLICPSSGAVYSQNDFKSFLFANICVPKEYIPEKYWLCDRMAPQTNQTVKIKKGTICKRRWEKEYISSAFYYPCLTDYAEEAFYEIPFLKTIKDETIERIKKSENKISRKQAFSLLTAMKRKNDFRLRETALYFAEKSDDTKVSTLAYNILAGFKNDTEIETLFINYLVEHSDNHDKKIEIINSYWKND